MDDVLLCLRRGQLRADSSPCNQASSFPPAGVSELEAAGVYGLQGLQAARVTIMLQELQDPEDSRMQECAACRSVQAPGAQGCWSVPAPGAPGAPGLKREVGRHCFICIERQGWRHGLRIVRYCAAGKQTAATSQIECLDNRPRRSNLSYACIMEPVCLSMAQCFRRRPNGSCGPEGGGGLGC